MAARSSTSVQQIASVAENVADEFSRYKSRLPDARLEVMAVVAGLYGFSASLYQFDSAVKNYSNLDHDILGQLNLILKSSSKALKDVEKLVKCMELAMNSSNPAFAPAWSEVTQVLQNDKIKLQDRFETFKERMSLLLANLHAAVNGKKVHISKSRSKLVTNDYADDSSNSSPTDYQMTMSPVSDYSSAFDPSPRSPYRREAFSVRAMAAPQFHGYLNQHPVPHRRRSSHLQYMKDPFIQYVDALTLDTVSDGSNSSQSSRDIYQSYYHPSVNNGPKIDTRRKSQPNLSKLLVDNGIANQPLRRRRSSITSPGHWASRVWQGQCSETKFPVDSIKLGSECFGKNMVVKQDTCEQELLKMKFASDFVVRLWRDEGSQRARIVCQVGNRKAPNRFQSTINLAYLSICRTGAAIELRFRETLWAILSFSTMEDLIIFYMTILVLRQSGCNPPALSPSEIFLDDEDLLYSGFISDDEGGEHYFRVLRDQDSGAVRIAAFLKGGDHQDLPVWTAFIKDSIHLKGWCSRHAAKVRLGYINLISFSDTYETSSYKNWELLFTGREDAKDFERVLKIDLRPRA